VLSPKTGWPKHCSKPFIISVPQVYETQKVEGHWRHRGILYRDNLVRFVVDVPDSVKNRRWMAEFKGRWKARLEQIGLWMVSYRIDLE
jgi:hypothetical protein